MQKQPLLVVVSDDRGIAFRGVVYVPVVANGPDGLHGVASHAGHGDGGQPVPHIVLENVLPLAVKQKNHGLQRQNIFVNGGHKSRFGDHKYTNILLGKMIFILIELSLT